MRDLFIASEGHRDYLLKVHGEAGTNTVYVFMYFLVFLYICHVYMFHKKIMIRLFDKWGNPNKYSFKKMILYIKGEKSYPDLPGPV